MYKNKTIAVVVPVYNEEKLISRVIETMPAFVDQMIVVDDKSSDNSAGVVTDLKESGHKNITLIRHEINQGVGGAIVTGYEKALAEHFDITVVMAGDAQMNPDDLPQLLDPVVADEADYVKGNRLFTGEAWHIIPHSRYLGNSLLSLLTKMASGYWHVADSQSGYTAANQAVLKGLDLRKIYPRYGMPNDMLIRLNIANFRVKDIPVKPVYNIGEKSGIRLPAVIPAILLLLTRGFFRRLLEKYVIRNFHPLVLFYILGIVTMPVGFLFGFYLILKRIIVGPVVVTSALFAAFLFITGLQSLFFAMWMDMEDNRGLVNKLN